MWGSLAVGAEGAGYVFLGMVLGSVVFLILEPYLMEYVFPLWFTTAFYLDKWVRIFIVRNLRLTAVIDGGGIPLCCAYCEHLTGCCGLCNLPNR